MLGGDVPASWPSPAGPPVVLFLRSIAIDWPDEGAYLPSIALSYMLGRFVTCVDRFWTCSVDGREGADLLFRWVYLRPPILWFFFHCFVSPVISIAQPAFHSMYAFFCFESICGTCQLQVSAFEWHTIVSLFLNGDSMVLVAPRVARTAVFRAQAAQVATFIVACNVVSSLHGMLLHSPCPANVWNLADMVHQQTCSPQPNASKIPQLVRPSYFRNQILDTSLEACCHHSSYS